MELEESITQFRSFDGNQLDLFDVKPEEYGATVMVVSEIWGLTEFIKSFSRRLAREGYRVIAPNLYSRPEDREILTEEKIMDTMRPMWSLPPDKRRDPESIKKIMENLNEDGKKIFTLISEKRLEMEKRMLSDLESLYRLQKKDNEKIGIVGFCMGGGLAFQLSTELEFDASAIFYGASPRNIEDMKNIRGALLCIYAGEDSGINATIKDVAEMVSKYKLNFEMKMYPGTYHAFFNDTGMSYNKDASEDAWERLLFFYRRNLQ